MTFNLIVLILLTIVFQLIIGHLWHAMGYSYKHSILLTLLPLGLGVFIRQICYYERHFPNWKLPLNIKIRLKYIYIITFCEFLSLYFCLFIFK
ncbi:hypothetical protein [Staphylococcus simiae]|uniref:Uncharacterized protein n=1 Tax=Staphylococcus simiae CCM 7213 = CCUG 51256 TaxID=911238 RepID=G5JL60_9STAP|nr:hypothetical protein [Staphylococcus simiae]EHJ07078.1 hypothetical protein SS7213T_11125 [Staphylococcus simiae CCM 7213 = CCUG 51256]SNV63932.1 Putative membrane spanning protein [Staphylococcus simiae]